MITRGERISRFSNFTALVNWGREVMPLIEGSASASDEHAIRWMLANAERIEVSDCYHMVVPLLSRVANAPDIRPRPSNRDSSSKQVDI